MVQSREVESVLVDTSIMVWLLRGKERGRPYVRYLDRKRIVIAFCTVAELLFGAYKAGYTDDSLRRMEAGLASAVVVQPDRDITERWARVRAEAQALSHALGGQGQEHDAWIAAIALHFELPLLTEDGDFDDFPGLRLVSSTALERSEGPA